MDRRGFVTALAAGAVASAAAEAQTLAEPRRIGVLWVVRSPTDLFRARLRELGWIEGRTIVIEERFAEGQVELLPGLARELVALRVDVIVAVSQLATEAARGATATIPIVMVTAGRPIETGLIQSLARPGGNVTGTVSMTPDLASKHVELLHHLAPAARRIALLANAANAGGRAHAIAALDAARSLGIEIEVFEIVTAADVAPALERIGVARPDALLVSPDPITVMARAAVFDLAARLRLPAVYGLTSMARAGGLASYAANFDVHNRRSADYVDKILRGASPAELPVEQPTLFELVVNLRTAHAAGLEVPRAILDRADEVIE